MKSLLLMSIAFVIAGCTGENPSSQVAESVKIHREATTQLAWDKSSVKPTDLFARWNSEKKAPSDVCRGLMELSGQDLTLFEEEIALDKNANLIGPCKDSLKKKIEDYWTSVRPQ